MRRLPTPPLLATLAAGLVLGAVAATAAPAPPDMGDMQRPGLSARLEASGSGTLYASGRMVAFGEVQGAQSISVSGSGARLNFEGRSVNPKRGTATLKRVSGRFYVTGTDVRLTIVARGMSVSIAGKGGARLSGSGVYRLNDSAEAEWNGSWIPVRPSGAFARPQAGPREDRPSLRS